MPKRGNIFEKRKIGSVLVAYWVLDPHSQPSISILELRNEFFFDTIIDMKKVAKLIIQSGDCFLLMYRSDHPTFGSDPDLPGGTAEEYDQSELVTMLREVEEEIGFIVDEKQVRMAYSGDDYSRNGTHYSLFIAKVSNRPEIRMSWEHSSYEWIKKEDFIKKAKSANDTYMHMAGNVLESLDSV